MLRGGGTDDQCTKLASSLRQLGHRVWVAGPAGREFSRVTSRLGVPFQATPPEGPLKLRFVLSAARMIRRQRIEIVHGHHGRDYWPTILAARFSGTSPKIVLTRHLAKSPSSWFSRRFLLWQCDAMIAVSEAVAKIMREGLSEPASPDPERRFRPPLRGDHSKIQVIFGGIDTDRFRPFEASELRSEWKLEPSHFAFAVAGGYDWPRGKGQREFLQAAACIHHTVPRARFLIVGRGSLADILREDIERLGLTGKAWLTPYCQDMAAGMNAIDCLVHPVTGTEALGLVICEAMACGKPVIASALDGIPEAFHIGGHGQLVPPDSVQALAEAMSSWARQPALGRLQREELHQRIAARFSLLTCAQGVNALYAMLMRARKPEAAPAS